MRLPDVECSRSGPGWVAMCRGSWPPARGHGDRFISDRRCVYDATAKLACLPQRVVRADALTLPLPNDAFDLVWSWGVLHHTGAIDTAVAEVQRVLRPRGEARLMLYNRPSWVSLAAWLRWGLLRGRPFQGLNGRWPITSRVLARLRSRCRSCTGSLPTSIVCRCVWLARTGTGSSFPVWAGSHAHRSAGSL